MKIFCPFCSNPFNDTMEKCPSCGAANAGVVRHSGSQPITIDELKDWYASKGLPPYETTRFFIGEDYKKPRAFGIYKDEGSGEFVVYKNKGNGERAVRYRGTDEAYAVNELFQRLKQEIIQQKGGAGNTRGAFGRSGKRPINWGCLTALIIFVGLPLILVIVGAVSWLFSDMPEDGYYLYEQTLYCHYDYVQPDKYSDWFYYDETKGWCGPQAEESVPELLRKDEQASEYYLSEELPASRTEPSFYESHCYQDTKLRYTGTPGYYKCEDTTYYHLDNDLYTGWYYYDTERGDWYERYYEDMPYQLQHGGTAEDFYYTPAWDSTTQITDFTESEIYEEYLNEIERLQQSSEWDNDDDNDYSWDSDDSWDSGGSDWDSDW